MTTLKEFTSWADDYLNTENIPDYPNAYNGLQVENDGKVSTIGYAVDASLKSIQQAADGNVDLLVVHHGLYWQGLETLTGAWREKCKLLIENNIALYSSHIPLDVHPKIGNNVLLARKLGLKQLTPCLNWKGIKLAIKAEANCSSKELEKRITELLNHPPFTSINNSDVIGEVVIITGGAGSQITEIKKLGCSTLISGEGSHWNIPYAEDHRINLLLGTHYLTETFGVEALANKALDHFNLKSAVKIHPGKFL